jgi:hypothetical protein
MTKEKEYTRFITDPVMEPYFISMDDHCMTVNLRVTSSESNKEYIKPVGHFSNLSSALSSIAKDITNSKSYDSIQAYVEEFRNVNNLITEKIKI